MLTNPFTPIFGGKPDFFFGRENILRRFDAALRDRGSDYRALFITGTRGFGKTTVLEQLSQRAHTAGWNVIDLTSDNPIETAVRRLAGATESTKTVDPSVGVSALGFGVSTSGVSSSHTVRYAREDLCDLVLDACEGGGLLITIDEVQKVPLDDVAAICDAFQMASRKGLDAILVVAGLPYSHGRVIQHEGCTYLRRAVHETLEPLTPEEVEAAYREAFALVGDIAVQDDALELLVSTSKGHPYIMQLLGYYLVEDVMNSKKTRTTVTSGDVNLAAQRALDAYAQRAVAPIIDALPNADIEYLRAMCSLLSPERVVKTGDIARALGKEQRQTSRSRQHLIDEGVVISTQYGELILGIPYLDDYLLGESAEDTGLRLRQTWGY